MVKHILVPTDFSDHGQHALHYAASLGERFGATLHVVYVNTLHGDRGEAEFPDLAPFLDRADQAARKELDAGVDHGGLAEATVKTEVLRGVNAHDAIVEYAKDKAMDIIVMATRGRSGLAYALLGSVAERVTRYAPCPVLAVEEGDRDFVDPSSGAVDIQNIVVAHDLTDNAQRAYEYAKELFGPYGPTFHLLHAIETEVPAIYSQVGIKSILELYPNMQKELTDLLEGRAGEGQSVVCNALEGDPYKVVPDYAEEKKADLIVVASDSKITLSERIVGGMAERILRHAPCPTLIA